LAGAKTKMDDAFKKLNTAKAALRKEVKDSLAEKKKHDDAVAKAKKDAIAALKVLSDKKAKQAK